MKTLYDIREKRDKDNKGLREFANDEWLRNKDKYAYEAEFYKKNGNRLLAEYYGIKEYNPQRKPLNPPKTTNWKTYRNIKKGTERENGRLLRMWTKNTREASNKNKFPTYSTEDYPGAK